MVRNRVRGAVGGSHKRTLGIEMEGPFFTGDPALTVRQNIRAAMGKLAEAGESEARRRAYGAPRKGTGSIDSPSYIVGRTTSRSGRRWATFAVVSAYGGIMERRPTKARAIAVQAALAGRRDSTADSTARRPTGILGIGGTRTVVTGSRYIGTTPGHEGTAKVFSKTASAMRKMIRRIDLTKGL